MDLKRILVYPLKIVLQFLSKIFQELNELRYPYSKRILKLNNSYSLFGFNKKREYYIKHLNKALVKLGFQIYNELSGMYSEHLIIFSAISKHNKNIKNILEIGTYDARTASVLASLFPNAIITTIDLRDDDPIFKESYNRDQNYKKFIRNRNDNIKRHKNIKFLQINSLELSIIKNLPKQDLIWVDGAHGYPVIVSDITNAIGLMKQDSILMCDDIWKKCKNNDDMYQSIAGYETLNAFSRANILENNYFRKRIGKKFNGNYKFVSFSRLTKKNS